VVVSNKSTDNTVEVARKLGLTVYEENRTLGGIGYGYAHMTGIKKAKGDIIVGIDGDATYPIEDLATIIDHMDGKKLDFIACTRYPLQGDTKIPFKLQLGVQALNIATRVLYGVKLHDVLSGMWVFRKSIRSKLKLTMGDWNLSPEIKVNAAVSKAISFGEFPIVQHRREGETKQHYIKTGMSHLTWLATNRLKKHIYTIRFIIVGGVAFVFNYAVLLILHRTTSLGKVGSEAISMVLSVHVTFFLHDRWTYAGVITHRHTYFWGIGKRYVSYVASNSFSAVLTVVMFALFSRVLSNLAALAIAAAISMIWNYILNKFVIWRKPGGVKADEEF
jgi:putative flippase GtrA